jgi:hypothetical protein
MFLDISESVVVAETRASGSNAGPIEAAVLILVDGPVVGGAGATASPKTADTDNAQTASSRITVSLGPGLHTITLDVRAQGTTGDFAGGEFQLVLVGWAL